MTSVPLGGNVREITISRPLTARQILMRGLRQSLRKPQGVLNSDSPFRFVLIQHAVRLDPKHIERFRHCCAYDGQAGGVPLPFPETRFTPLMAQVLVSDDFPLSPLGIIHLRQTATQHRRPEPDAEHTAVCELVQMRNTERGVEFDFQMRLLRRRQLCWSGTGTMLSRIPRRVSKRKPRSSVRSQDTRNLPRTRVSVPGSTGRQFARASGDWNLQHLWTPTAWMVGFRRPIAHGMWTFSRALAVALSRVDADTSVSAEAVFRRPLFLPSTVDLSANVLGAGCLVTNLDVRDSRTGLPHLSGQASVSSG